MASARVRSIAVLGGVAILLAWIAVNTFQKGAWDVAYQLADLKEDPLYLRGPGWTVTGGIIVSVVYAVIALVARAVWRRSRARPTSTSTAAAAAVPAPVAPVAHAGPRAARAVARIAAVRPRWWWVLVAGWGSYLLGGAVSYVAGAPVDHPGTMTLTFGAPLAPPGTDVTVPATCRSIPGHPGTIAVVSADGTGFRVILRDRQTGLPWKWSGPTGVRVDLYGERDGRTLVIPGLPDRPPLASFLLWSDLGSDAILIDRPTPILDAYGYDSTSATFTDTGGSVRATAGRGRNLLETINDLIPDDPWPDTYALGIDWTCDLGATRPVTAEPTPIRERWPTKPPGAVPGTPRPASAVTPIDLQIDTSSAAAAVTVTGVTIVSVEGPTMRGSGRYTYKDGTFRVIQTPDAFAAGDVLEATFHLTIRDVPAGSKVGLTIARGETGLVAVTIYNALGPEPVPVFTYTGISADRPGWPIVIPEKWLTQPVVLLQRQ